MTYQDVLAALADSTRRAVLERLRERELSVGELARNLPVTRPAVSQHLKVLREAGLVSERRVGNRRLYRIDPRGLVPLRRYLEQTWGQVLDAFGRSAGEARMIEPLVKTIVVPLEVSGAFELFTGGMGSWWPLATHSVGAERARGCRFEARAGGRIYEIMDDGTESEWGVVKLAEFPRRVVFTWHPGRPASTAQEVEVTFRGVEGGTEVRLEHRGWERYGENAEAARDRYDTGWDQVFGARYGGRARQV
jgi:DNA-binding transcriptional ArsR family regulator